jgi:hypothetical protein
MPLYDRLIGFDDAGVPVSFRIPVHGFSALMGEFARTQITGAQAQAGVTAISGAPLDATGVAEAQTLLATVTGSAVAKLARAKEIDDVLILAERGRVAGYQTPTLVKARLGV